MFEDFKSYFAAGRYARSSTEHDAEWDLHKLVDDAAQNAPVSLAAFADACADFKKIGYCAVQRIAATGRV